MALALGALLELGLHEYFSRAAPDAGEWRALAPRVSELARDADTLIVVAPRWGEPSARQVLGDELMPLRHVARAETRRFPRALEISFLGQRSAELSGWKQAGIERVGPFALRRLDNPTPLEVRFDFLEELGPGRAHVAIGEPGKPPAPCAFRKNARVVSGDLQGNPTFPRRRFQCPGGGAWQFVGRTVIEDERYLPRRCIWAHAPRRGSLSIVFDDVPVARTLRGHAGLPYFVERDERGTPVELEVLVGGKRVGSMVHADGEGWKLFEMSTKPLAGQRASVEFRVASRRARLRQFCFEAVVL